MSLKKSSTSSSSKDVSEEASNLIVKEMTSLAIDQTINHMVPVVFLEEIHETKNLKEFVRYTAQLRLSAEKIRQHMSESAERQLTRYINSLRSENKISDSEMDWTQWDWEKFKQIAESLFDALKSVEERQQSLTDRQIISDLVKNFTGELKDLSFGVYGTEMKHTLKFIERYESVLVKKNQS